MLVISRESKRCVFASNLVLSSIFTATLSVMQIFFATEEVFLWNKLTLLMLLQSTPRFTDVKIKAQLISTKLQITPLHDLCNLHTYYAVSGGKVNNRQYSNLNASKQTYVHFILNISVKKVQNFVRKYSLTEK